MLSLKDLVYICDIADEIWKDCGKPSDKKLEIWNQAITKYRLLSKFEDAEDLNPSWLKYSESELAEKILRWVPNGSKLKTNM